MTETVFASDTTNKGTVTTSDLEGGFGGCGGDGLPMTSANFNKVIGWLSNIEWDGIPFTDLTDYEGKDFQITELPSGQVEIDDELYIRRGNEVYRMNTERLFTDTCLPTLPDASGACEIEQIVKIVDQSGCAKFATYSESSAQLGRTDTRDFFGIPYPNTLIPSDPTTPGTSYYRLPDLRADIDSNSVDNTLLESTGFLSVTFEINCDNTPVDLILRGNVEFDLPADSGVGRLGRFAVREDGDAIKEAFPTFTNASNTYQQTLTRTYDSGTHTVEVFVVAAGNNFNSAQILAFADTGRASHSLTAVVGVS